MKRFVIAAAAVLLALPLSASGSTNAKHGFANPRAPQTMKMA